MKMQRVKDHAVLCGQGIDDKDKGKKKFIEEVK